MEGSMKELKIQLGCAVIELMNPPNIAEAIGHIERALEIAKTARSIDPERLARALWVTAGSPDPDWDANMDDHYRPHAAAIAAAYAKNVGER